MRLWGASILCGVLGLGCETPVGCPELCARQAQCRQDLGVMGADEQACVEQCEALSSEDPAYAEVIAERAACVADEECEAIVYGYGCLVEGD